MELGKRLEKLRCSRGLTRKQVAAKIGVSESTYRDLEYGVASRKAVPMLIKLSAMYKLDVGELLTGEPSKTPGLILNKIRQIERLVADIIEYYESAGR